jgi:hypothetical protein
MIAATSLILGIMSAGLRSVVGYAVVSFLILATFGTAYVNSSGQVGFGDLAIAILSFNLGIITLAVATGVAIYLRRPVNN